MVVIHRRRPRRWVGQAVAIGAGAGVALGLACAFGVVISKFLDMIA